MLRIDEGLLDKNWRPSQKTVVETKVSLREKVAELNRKVGKLETCIANNEEQQTTSPYPSSRIDKELFLGE